MLGHTQRAANRPRLSACSAPSQCTKHYGRRVRRAAAPEAGSGGDSAPSGAAPGAPALSEDMIARLRAAEEEAARLKKQLADMQLTQVCEAAPKRLVALIFLGLKRTPHACN